MCVCVCFILRCVLVLPDRSGTVIEVILSWRHLDGVHRDFDWDGHIVWTHTHVQTHTQIRSLQTLPVITQVSTYPADPGWMGSARVQGASRWPPTCRHQPSQLQWRNRQTHTAGGRTASAWAKRGSWWQPGAERWSHENNLSRQVINFLLTHRLVAAKQRDELCVRYWQAVFDDVHFQSFCTCSSPPHLCESNPSKTVWPW